MAEIRTRMKELLQVPIFASLSRQKLQKLYYDFELGDINPKHVLFHEGEIAK